MKSSTTKMPASGAPAARAASPCLCVDLDGTLVQTDTLLESLLALMRARPLSVFRIVFWLFLGKARFKQEVGRLAELQTNTLPYDSALLDYLAEESQAGRKLLLVTAADSSVALPVAEHLGIFSAVICSDGRENIAGGAKLAAIRRLLGDQEFSYAGNSRVDLPIWRAAKSAVVVGAARGVRQALERSGVAIEKSFPRPKLSFRTILKAARVHQWTKNLLVLTPIVLGHHVLEWSRVTSGLRAFFAFSLCASAIYLVNDLLDLKTDRQHARKRLRPLAAGRLSIFAAVAMAVLFAVGAALLNPTREAAVLLAVYALCALAYSVYLKRLLMVDVIMLAVFYTLRLLYGGAGTRIELSIWTLAFSMFMFLSLALIKRISELRSRTSEEGLTASGRGYQMNDLPQLTSLCAASGCVSALIVILYVRSPDIGPLYSRPHLLLGIFPLLAYWQSRLLILANRGAIQDDPIMFSLFDRASQAVAIALLAVILAAI